MLDTMIIGIMKEIVDKFNNGTPSWKDIFPYVIGIIIGFVLSIFQKKINRINIDA